jgi:hypothetical protein
MANLYIHCGFGKTGTSSLQSILLSNRNFLLQSNVYYMDNLGAGDNHFLNLFPFLRVGSETHSILSKYNPYPNLGNAELSDFLLINMKSDIEAIDSSNWIFSSEAIINLEPLEMYRLFDFFSTYFDSIKLVVYLRDPYSWACSAGLQTIKDGNTFLNLLKYPLLNHFPQNIHVLKSVLSAYSNFSIIFRKYEDVVGSGHGVGGDFLSIINPELNLDFIDKSVYVNPSLCLFQAIYFGNLNSIVDSGIVRLKDGVLLSEINIDSVFPHTGVSFNYFGDSYNAVESSAEFAKTFLAMNYGVYYENSSRPLSEDIVSEVYKVLNRSDLDDCTIEMYKDYLV